MFSKRNIVLLLTNITTFSTTGYVAMGVLIIGYAILGRLKLTYKFFIVFILAILIPFVVQLDFISAKIIQQSGELDVTWSRFGALYYHWSQIVKSPIIGYGPFLANASSELLLSPNGITDIIRYYGFPLSTVFYIMLYKGTRLYIGTSNPKINICCFIVIITLCFSQTITLSPFFYLLYFLAFNKSSSVNFLKLTLPLSSQETISSTNKNGSRCGKSDFISFVTAMFSPIKDYLNFLMMIAPLCPPKPKFALIAASTFISIPLFGT